MAVNWNCIELSKGGDHRHSCVMGDNAIRKNCNYSWPEGVTLLVAVSSISVFITCLLICNTCSDNHGFIGSSWPFHLFTCSAGLAPYK